MVKSEHKVFALKSSSLGAKQHGC